MGVIGGAPHVSAVDNHENYKAPSLDVIPGLGTTLPYPTGVVGIFTWPDGGILASTSDFDISRPGGFDIVEAQKYRVKQKLRYEVARKLCNDVFVNCISEYHLQDIINEMIRKEGFKMHLIEVPEHKETEE